MQSIVLNSLMTEDTRAWWRKRVLEGVAFLLTGVFSS